MPPMHWTRDNLPVGARFAAPFGREGRLLALAARSWNKPFPGHIVSLICRSSKRNFKGRRP